MLRHVFGALGTGASLILAGVAWVMAFRFGYALGKTPADGMLYGVAAVAAGALLLIAPFFFASALRQFKAGTALASFSIMAVMGLFIVTTSLGHSSMNRGDATAKRVDAGYQVAELKGNIERYKADLASQPEGRASAIVAAELEKRKTYRQWQLSGECSNPNSNWERRFCRHTGTLQTELAAAQTREALEAKIQKAELRYAMLQASGATSVASADPQAQVISTLLIKTGIVHTDAASAEENTKLFLTLLLPLVLEVGAYFGLWMSLAAWGLSHSLDLPTRAHMALERARIAANDDVPVRAAPAALGAPISAEAAHRQRSMLSHFWAHCMEPLSGQSTLASAAYLHYQAACRDEGEQPVSYAVFLRSAAPYVAHQTESGGQTIWHGVSPVTRQALAA